MRQETKSTNKIYILVCIIFVFFVYLLWSLSFSPRPQAARKASNLRPMGQGTMSVITSQAFTASEDPKVVSSSDSLIVDLKVNYLSFRSRDYKLFLYDIL